MKGEVTVFPAVVDLLGLGSDALPLLYEVLSELPDVCLVAKDRPPVAETEATLSQKARATWSEGDLFL